MVIIVASFVLGFVKTKSPLNQETPSKFYIYDNSAVAQTVTKESDPELFDKLCAELENLTNISVAARLIQGGSVNEQPSQDIDQNYGEITVDLVKHTSLVLEVVWENKQQQIVEINGDKKVLEYYSCAIVLDDTAPQLLPICLSQSTPSSVKREYKGSPMLVRGTTAGLFNVIKSV